ncbi:MAG TPA: helix-turn-helix transcriptional regulator [Candidatus Acidoferrum sp.]|nr:helix-turn-helix transcriptional regulator [Candidatus Acidoferrum sp.]
MLHIAARPRSSALAPFIAAFHYNEGKLPDAVERILPNGQAHLMVNLEEDQFRTYSGPDCSSIHRMRGAVLAGPHGRSTAIDTREQRRLVAIEFKIGGAAAFFSMPLSQVNDQAVELGDLWPGDGCLLRERLCEARTPADKFSVLEIVLLEHFLRPWDPAMRAAIFFLERGLSVAEAASRTGLLPKTFLRRFCAQTGLPPKRLSRVRRLQRIVRSLPASAAADWCMIAAAHGYADQAHFIHDFRELAGMTPTAYRPSSPKQRNHVPVVQRAV